VSNDTQHLIPLSPWRGTPIISAEELLARVDAARHGLRSSHTPGRLSRVVPFAMIFLQQ
jgi:hypothetical protein